MHRNLLLSLIALMALAGCGQQSAESSVAAARKALLENNSRTAVIELKNALQQEPNLAEARYLLGKALLDQGDPRSANVELDKAVDLQYPAKFVAPPRAESLNDQGRSDRVIAEYADTSLGDPSGDAELQTQLAVAYAQQNDATKAKAAVDRALKADPNHPSALLFRARLLASQDDLNGALKIVDDVLAIDAKSAAAWKLKGDLMYFAKNDGPGALAAYRAALKIKPGLTGAHTGILSILLASKSLDEANAELQEFKKAVPTSAEARYYEALLAFHKRDFKAARQLTQQLLTVAPNNAKVLYLAGAIALEDKSYLQAESFANKVLQAAPANLSALRLISQTYLQSGQPTKVLRILLPYVDVKSPDPELVAFVANAYLMDGDVANAQAYFERASQLDPHDMGSRTALALTHIAAGDSDSAFDELRSISASDKGSMADLALISALLQKNKADEALQAIDALQRKQPENPLPFVLRGRVEAARKDAAAARASFEHALKLSPTYFPAVVALANMDMAEGRKDDARQRFDKLLEANPNSLQALLALAQWRLTTGAGKDAVVEALGRAVRGNPSEPSPRLLLIDQYLKAKDTKLALEAAEDAVAALPDNPAILDALGRAQLASDNVNQALATFNKLVELQPDSQEPHLRLAEVYVSLKQPDAAIQSLKRALAAEPGSVAAQRGLISLELARGRTQEALQQSRALQTQRGNEAMGYALEGEVDTAMKDWDAAAAAYRNALQRQKSPGLAVKLHKTLVAGHKRAEADRFAAGWMKDNPKDDVFIFYLADAALSRKDYAEAETRYRAFIALRPNSPIAMNNLAWILSEQHKPGAVDLAEQANKLAPDQPQLMDTLATLLARDNQVDKAVALQQKAVTLKPDVPSLRLNLARLMLKSGDKAGAREQLDTLAKLGDKFPDQGDVDRLRKSL